MARVVCASDKQFFVQAALVVHQLCAGMVASCYSLLLTFHVYLFKLDQNT
jgi:hypothetical protein